MLDIRLVHIDFKGKTAFAQSTKFFDWLPNRYCLCCFCHHDLVLVRLEDQYQDTIAQWKEHLVQDLNSAQAEHARKLLEDDKTHVRLVNRIYCPYQARSRTAWTETFYELCLQGEEAVNNYSGPNKDDYIARYKQFTNSIDSKIKENDDIIKNHATMLEDIKKTYAYLKKKKTQVDDIIHNACELRKQADDAISNRDINWMRRFWDERY